MRRHLRTRRATTALPAAIAGSIALSLATSSAHAAEPAGPLRSAVERAPETLPAVAARTVPATYTVVRGDTVSAIAHRFGLRTSDVLAWNRLGWSSLIRPGQVLRLHPAGAPKPRAGAPETHASSPRASTAYVVRAGDTVSAIAQRHGVGVAAVLRANRLTWESVIYPGQRIAVPGAAASVTPTPVRAAAESRITAYVVTAGDTVSAIAAKHHVSVEAILRANRLTWGSIIYPGQRLAIPAAAAGRGVAGLSAEQAANARTIIRVGRQLGVSDRGIAIALGTAMQESALRNLDWGDRDSLGLFQQRPSAGWGTPAQVRDTTRAARVFFGGASDPNGDRTRGLLDIPGWSRMSFAQAAQAVQISAYPDRYAQWEKPAYAWLAALG